LKKWRAVILYGVRPYLGSGLIPWNVIWVKCAGEDLFSMARPDPKGEKKATH